MTDVDRAVVSTCVECGREEAELLRVEYVEAGAERLRLCEECRTGFEAGDLVTDVVAVPTDYDDPGPSGSDERP